MGATESDLRVATDSNDGIRIKGLAVQARLDYLEREHGSEGLLRVIAGLRPEHRNAIEQGVLVSGWYPLSLSDDLLGCAERLLGRGDGSLCRQIGRASGRKGLTTVHSVFGGRVDAVDIGAKMARSTKLVWQVHYDRGAMVTRELGPYAIVSVLEDFEVQEPWLCHVLTGYLGAHIAVLGGHDVTVEHTRCRCEGDDRCEWISRWT